MTLRMLGQPCASALSAASLSSTSLAAAPAAVGGDQQHGAGILDAILERQRRESAEHHRMDGADARAGVHGDDGLGRHRHVDDHAIAGRHALREQRIGEAAHVGVQLAVGHMAHVAGLADEGQRGLVAALLEMHIEAVVGDIELAVGEPAIVGRLRFVQRDGERLVPAQLAARLARPEALVVGGGLGTQGLHVGGFEAGPGGEFGGRGKTTFFDENGFDVLAVHRGAKDTV